MRSLKGHDFTLTISLGREMMSFHIQPSRREWEVEQ
jgi:hypothetical protein